MEDTELKTLNSMGLEKDDIEKENKVFEQLQTALQSELQAIRDYQNQLNVINQERRDNVPGINKSKLVAIADAYKEIIKDEYNHIGVLTRLLKLVDPNAQVGIPEGIKELGLGE